MISSTKKAYAGLLFAVVAVSFAALFVRLTSAPPSVTAMYRMLLSAVVLFPLVRKSFFTQLFRLALREKLLILVSGISLGIHFIFWMTSVFTTSIASATLLLAFQPVFAMLLEWIFFHKKIAPRLWLYVFIALIGTAVIGWHDLISGHQAILGDALSLVSAFAAAGYMVTGSGVRRHFEATAYNVSVFFVAGVFLFLYSFVLHDAFWGYSTLNWVMTLFLVLVPTLLGHAVFNTLLKYLPASTISMSIIGEPIVASLLAYLFLHQNLSFVWFIGASILLIAIGLFVHDGYRTSKSA